ncbi:MAG: hypothetical protein CSA94_00420 [Bacteroidetes bacterium]|nr:MAG: hypothetical protein CSA94_00420 [Bacteroidota bacterium]
MDLEELALQGRKKMKRTMAYNIALRATEIKKELIKKSLTSLKQESHRMEHVSTIQGIDFIDDSFSTNVNSTWYALHEINKPIIWIAGGIDLDNDYSTLSEMARRKVKCLIVLGVNNQAMINSFSNVVKEIYSINTMKNAVEWAYQLANEGDVVLLSPSCASYDLFIDYKEKGDTFQKMVKKL